MELENIKNQIIQDGAAKNLREEVQFGDHILNVDSADILAVMTSLRAMKFDFMMDLCGVDYPNREKRFDVVYQLYSSSMNQRLRIKTQVGEHQTIDSITPVWKGANWFEREAYDLVGVKFKNHPNLKRILTHNEFVGHPLQKTYDADQQQHLSQSLPVHFDPSYNNADIGGENLVPLNIGPSHPATHGTLRVMAALDGEKIAKANVEIGYLHRCFDKMAETHPYNQVIPYTDRLNYCSAPINNVAYCATVEKLLGVDIPPKAQALRIILCELSRIIDHIVCIGAASVDLGALTGFFHLFTYREMVYTLFEKLCGARLTVSLTRIGGMAQEPPPNWHKEVLETCDKIAKGIEELDTLVTGNKIFIIRTSGVAAITTEEAIRWGYTGPLLRSTGMAYDIRKVQPYYGYDQLDFDVPVGTTGDLYDRYLVRVEEMRQSLRIIRQVAKNIPEGDYTIRDKNIVLPEKKDVYGNIEGLMNHFMLVIHGLRPPVGETYLAHEGANGELGFYIVSDGSGKPYRVKVRPPCFPIYQSLPEQITGGLVADVVAVLGSMNVIAGELDR